MAYNNVKVKARQTVAQTNTPPETLGVVTNVPMGEWNNTTSYKKLNLVRYNGATYIATRDNQGATPTGSGIWLLVSEDGRGVQSSIITYQSGVSGTTLPTGEWVSEVPEVPQGQYLWTRTIVNYTDNTQSVSYSVSLQGLNFTQQDRENINRINDAIPSSASETNPLATHDFVNSSINNLAAFYITRNAQGDAFATRASLLSATIFYQGGQTRVPTQNDYAIVLADESQPKGVDGSYPTTRYSYQGGTYPNGQWDFQYVVNNTSLTQAQVDAINSGITAQKIANQDNSIASKVNKSGDTMTGDLSIEKTGAMITATDGTQAVALHMGSGGVNRGVFDKTNRKWLFYADTIDGSSLILNANTNVKGELKENGKRVYSPNNLPSVGYNMLINPDSAINQRGITTLSQGTGYMSDRWYKMAGSNSNRIDIENGTYTITITGVSSSWAVSRALTQAIECSESLWGKQVTFSVNVIEPAQNNDFSMFIYALNAQKGIMDQTQEFVYLNTAGLKYATFTVPQNTVYLQVAIDGNFRNGTIGNFVKFNEPKLEIGTVAMPFSPPNIVEELPKCQRYYIDTCYQIKSNLAPYALGSGLCFSASFAYFVVPIPTSMRVSAAQVSSKNNIDNLVVLVDGQTLPITAITVIGSNNTSITIRATGTFEIGSAAVLRVKAGENALGILAFDAEI